MPMLRTTRYVTLTQTARTRLTLLARRWALCLTSFLIRGMVGSVRMMMTAISNLSGKRHRSTARLRRVSIRERAQFSHFRKRSDTHVHQLIGSGV